MRRAEVFFLPALVAMAGCALVAYDFDGYGPAPTSTSGSGAAEPSGSGSGNGSGSGSGSGSGAGSSSGSGTTSPCTAPPFAVRVDVPVLQPPFSLQAADMNGDDKPDVVMTNPSANWLSLIFNNGVGKLVQQQEVVLPGNAPAAVAVGNFTADTFRDAVTVDAASEKYTLFVDPGSGVLSASAAGDLAAGPTALVAGDFTGDALTDIMMTCDIDSGVFLLSGNGNGGLGGAQLAFVVDGATAIAADYLDADNQLDLVVLSASGGTVNVLLRKGSIYSATIFTVPAPQQVAIADFDNDGHPDIAVTSNSLSGTLLVSKDDGSFDAFASALNFGVVTYGIATADFDGDGHQDIAATSDTGVVLLFGDGNGTFLKPTVLPGLPGGRDIRAVDLNKDGWVDLVEGSGTQKLLGVFYNSCAPNP
jgi:hypothetical protein